MIDPSEYETTRLQASVKHHVPSTHDLSKRPLDKADRIGSGTSTKVDKTIRMDTHADRIYQTRIGNPELENSHSATWLPDRVIGKGVKVADDQTPSTQTATKVSSSRLLARYLDTQATFVPSIAHGLPTSMHTVPPTEPFLSPGLTSVNARKYTPHFH